MNTIITYENGGIRIHMGKLNGNAPKINAGCLQNRLSQADFMQFWSRIKATIECNLKIDVILAVLLWLMVLGLGILKIVRYISIPVLIAYFVWFFILLISVIVNTVMKRKKLRTFIAKENSEIWNARGLYLQIVRVGKTSHLEFRLAPSAGAYQPPNQLQQLYVHGGMQDAYMQSQANFYTQNQPGNY